MYIIPKGIRERQTRWPFLVNSPLKIIFYCGEQWQQYNFNPGTSYLERIDDRRQNE